VRFFLKNKGSISIFLAIILVPMLTISGIIVDSSRIKLGKGVVSSAVDLTLNTALTNYDGVLKEIYGLFAMSQTIEELNKNLETHFKKTIMGSNIPEEEADEYTRGIMESLHAAYPQLNDEGFSDFMKIDYSNFSFEKIPNSQLSNPKILKKQVVDFMKYRGPISMGMGFFQSLKSFNNLEKKNDVIEKKTKYYEAQSDVNQICKDIYELIEEYLDISHNERGEGVGITNAYLEFLANQLKGIEENYKGYNKKLVMDLYDNSLEIAPIKYTITGSGGNYTVKSSDGTSRSCSCRDVS
jgi:DNA-binding ferritin-like protein